VLCDLTYLARLSPLVVLGCSADVGVAALCLSDHTGDRAASNSL
jgi:hypothetical protein